MSDRDKDDFNGQSSTSQVVSRCERDWLLKVHYAIEFLYFRVRDRLSKLTADGLFEPAGHGKLTYNFRPGGWK